MAKDDGSVSRAEVDAIVARVREETTRSVLATLQQQQQQQAEVIPGHDNWREKLAKAPPQKRVTILSPYTGALIACDVDTRNRMMLKIEDGYRYPDGHDRHQDEGGLVPNGMPIADAETGQKTPLFKQWLYESYLKLDLERLQAKPFAPHFLAPETTDKAAE